MAEFPYENPIANQVAIVTGAGQGIGRGIALRLARDGMHVVVADLKAEQAEGVAAEIRALGVQALAVGMDVTKEVDRQRLISTTLSEMGRLDALVNNAGIQRASGPLDVTEEHWDLMMSVNTKAVWFMCQAAMKHFVAQKSGRIVNLASIAGKMASTQNHPVYNVAKAGVIAMTKTFAHTGAVHGVRVNCVCPGVIVTAMQDLVDAEFSRLQDKPAEQIRAERLSRIPMGKMGRPEEVADVISFLVGPDSRYMTGQAINVSGGMVMY
jgi:meso-butanediol dehydrogenase / (S,S)-butanediol dehydrogenase / diacetyl reductase